MNAERLAHIVTELSIIAVEDAAVSDPGSFSRGYAQGYAAACGQVLQLLIESP